MPATTSQSDHQDWLGTERARTSTSGAVTESFGSLPFGDDFTYNAPEGDWSPYHFAGYDQDRGPQRQVFVAGVEDNSANGHAQFREYSNMAGRWFSPDPYQGSYDPTNPQSFNRYAYVLNSPLSFIDPAGLGPGDCFLSGLSGNTCSVTVSGNPPGGPGGPSDGSVGIPLIFKGGQHGQGGPGTAPNNTACNIQRATSGVMGAANLGLAVGKAFALGGAVAGLGATGVGAPAAAVLAVYGTVSIFGQGLAGAAQLYSAATGNYGTAAQVAQIGNILSGPVSGLATLVGGGSLATAERNAGYESAFTAGAGLIDAIRAGGAGLALAMADHNTAQMSLFGAGGGNACGAGH